jgi:phosphoribosylformylglycinamidine (FGAM) synthase-like enzyme
MLDEALGYQAFSATGSADTLTIPDGTTGVARSIYIQLNGTGGGSVAVPTAKTKMYFVFNNTASAITFKVTGQTGVSIPAAAKMALVSNGTDIIVAQNDFSALTLGAALPVASGGTSLTTLTANNVILGNGTSAPTFVAPSTSGNVLTSNGTTWQSTAPAASGATKGQAIAFSIIFGL